MNLKKNKKIISKNYGSIPHFSFSKLGEKDYKCNEGHEKILIEKTRDWKDLIIVTEKLDGSNVGIIKKDNKIYAITRTGYEAITSKYKQHYYFDKWVKKYISFFKIILEEGERICGEWLLKTHGIKYDISHDMMLFRPFDFFNKNNERLIYLELLEKIKNTNMKTPQLLHIGQPIKIKYIKKKLQEIEKNRINKCEGAIYRCEREGKVDFLVKYVRQDKEDGKYMDNDEMWNYDYKKI